MGALANTGGGVLGEPPSPATGCSHMHNLLSEAHRAGPTICGSTGPKRATERTGGLEGMWRMTPRREWGDWPHQCSSEPGKSAGTQTNNPTRAKDTPPRNRNVHTTRRPGQTHVRRTRGQPRKEPPMLSTPNSPTGETLPRGPGNHRAPSQLCPAQTPRNDGDAGDAASPLFWQVRSESYCSLKAGSTVGGPDPEAKAVTQPCQAAPASGPSSTGKKGAAPLLLTHLAGCSHSSLDRPDRQP